MGLLSVLDRTGSGPELPSVFGEGAVCVLCGREEVAQGAAAERAHLRNGAGSHCPG